MAAILLAQDAQVTALMSKDLPEFPSKDASMVTVVYPPGASDPIHRHNAHALFTCWKVPCDATEGRQDDPQAGQSFYVGPNDIPCNRRNASTTKPAKFVVRLLKNKDTPVLVAVKVNTTIFIQVRLTA